MSNPLVTYTLEDKTAVVVMDDGKANALGTTMMTELLAALARAEKEASAIVLAGRAERFCAGFDLRAMMSGRDAAIATLRQGVDVLLGFYGTPLPLVIACTGHALAGGALLALTGDLRLGAAGPFKVGLNEVAIGLPVPLLAMEFARDRLSKRALTRATLLATIYTPADAVDAGYLDGVVAASDLLARAKEEAARLGALSPMAYRATKELLRRPTVERIRAGLDADLARFNG
ncbi:MAG TPA: crotonase/enoyl-CoA hydratase family protein [Polyangia bacterium]|nr:crotonase/enoyl-CoA hydratase family protein [Polyangia bacterium]